MNLNNEMRIIGYVFVCDSHHTWYISLVRMICESMETM